MKKILIILLLIPTFVFSQELRARVSVNFEQLPTSAKDKLVNFENDVENYLNNTRFTNLDWEGPPISCSFNIFFLSHSGETNYSAQVVVNSLRPIYKSRKNSLMMNIMDKEWSFTYEKDQSLRFNQVDFDPLISFLDFYAYLIIGFDMDSYEPKGGSEFFDRAYEITILGANNKFNTGWTLENKSYNKRKLLEEIGGAEFERFRKDYFDYHYNGLDLFAQNREAARKNIAKLVNHLYEDIDKIGRGSVYLKVFFDAKASEFVEYMTESEDEDLFAKLIRLDPGNQSKYEKYAKD